MKLTPDIEKVALLIGLLFVGPSLSADNDEKKIHNCIGVFAGVNIPMYKNTGEGAMAGLAYSNWSGSGLGFKTGFQYTSKIARIDKVFGIPVAVSFRTKEIKGRERMLGAAQSAARSLYSSNSHKGIVRNAFFSFLVGLVSNTEFYAGITPGYIFGSSNSTLSEVFWLSGGKSYWEKHWTELKYRFSTSLDIGMNWNYRIWRFDLKLMPAFHFNITDNFILHTSEGNSKKGETYQTVQHARWCFSVTGGLSFNF